MTAPTTDRAPLPKTFGQRDGGGGGDLVPDQCARCARSIERPEQIRRAWCSGRTLYFAIHGLDPRKEMTR